MTDCLICNKIEKVQFIDNYKFQFQEDRNYFKKAKVYRCEDCDFSFVNPMPSLETLDFFIKISIALRLDLRIGQKKITKIKKFTIWKIKT